LTPPFPEKAWKAGEFAMNFVVRKGKKQIAFSMPNKPARALHHFLRASATEDESKT
jgi:hypothetical protein